MTVVIPSLFEELNEAGVFVHTFDVSEADGVADHAILSGDEQSRAQRFRRSEDARLFVSARAAVRRILATELSLAPESVPIELGLHGRPQLPAESAESLDFNVTHSTTRVAIAVARGRRVGIDIESVSATRNLELLIQEVMGPGERARLERLTGPDRAFAFYECWTRKEAILKAVGVGVGYPVREIDTPILSGGGRVSIRPPDEMPTSRPDWIVRTARVSDDFVLSIAFGER